MKTTMKVLGLAVVMGLAAAGAYAAGEEGMVQVPVKNLPDFQAQYTGTKPVIAINRYFEYKALQLAPRPTLATARIRGDERGRATGTKPVVGILQRLGK